MKKPSLPCVCFLFTLILAFSFQGNAQEIPSPSFEATSLEQSGSPFLADGEASGAAVPWSFGVQAGIYLEKAAYAEHIGAAEGRQVAARRTGRAACDAKMVGREHRHSGLRRFPPVGEAGPGSVLPKVN